MLEQMQVMKQHKLLLTTLPLLCHRNSQLTSQPRSALRRSELGEAKPSSTTSPFDLHALQGEGQKTLKAIKPAGNLA